MKNTHLLLIVLIAGLFHSCVQDTTPLTLQIKALPGADTTIKTLGLRGEVDPLSWYSDTMLTGPDDSGYYIGKIVFHIPYRQIEAKLVANGSRFELDNQPGRSITWGESDTLVYWATFDQLPEEIEE